MNKKIIIFSLFFVFLFLFSYQKRVNAQSCGYINDKDQFCKKQGYTKACDSIDQPPVGECKKVWFKCCDACRPNEQNCDGGNYEDNGPIPIGTQNCSAKVSPDGNSLNYSATDCGNKAWSATLYVCSTRACGNNAKYGVCHTECDKTAKAFHLDGTVSGNNWSQTIRPSNFSGASVNCKLAQLDGAINTNTGQETGYTVIDNLGTCGGASPTPTPTPTPTLTPTPIPHALSCAGLSSPSERTPPSLGNTISLTCNKNASYLSAVTYNFRLIKKASPQDSVPIPVPTAFVQNSTNNTTSYKISREGFGYYLFQCQVCAGAICTDWQAGPL